MELLALIPIGSPKVQSSIVRARSTRESTIDRQLAGDTMDSGTTTRPWQRLQATRFVVESVTSASVYVAPEMEGLQKQLIDEVGECAVGLQKRHGRCNPSKKRLMPRREMVFVGVRVQVHPSCACRRSRDRALRSLSVGIRWQVKRTALFLWAALVAAASQLASDLCDLDFVSKVFYNKLE